MQTSAREAALAALERCRRDGAWSGASIDSVKNKYSLDRRDAALASRLCLGVLQNSSLCDYYIDLYSTAHLEPKLRDILRLGAYQLMFMDKIPARAAVNESVLLCRQAGLSRATGLANALLRKIADNIDKLPEIPGKGSAGYLSIKYSHPQWLVERLIAQQGYDFAEAFLKANNTPPELCIQLNRLKTDVQDYKRALERAELEYKYYEELPGCFELPKGVVSALPGYDEGLFYVQDRAARTAVRLAEPKPGMRVLDACAAPGGKSFAAALEMENKGEIISCDIHEKKLARISSGAKRLGIDIIKTRARDARLADKELLESFDLVIADVPCSGLGVIRKKPEIRMKSQQELEALPGIQREILENLSSFVKPGGSLMYCTCTVLSQENQDIVQSFLKDNPRFEPEEFSLGGLKSKDGMYCFWPQIDGTDGFFAAKMKRKS